MGTLRELAALLRDSLALVAHRWAPLTFWFCCGWALHEVGMLGSVLLGADHAGWATLAFLAGVIGYAAAVVLMLASLRDRLRFPQAMAASRRGRTGFAVPEQVFAAETRPAMVALALGPFLAIYTLWGLADEEVTRLFETNILVHGNGGVTEWSVNLTANLSLYLWLAAGAWAVKQLALVVTRRRPSAVAGLLATAADAVFVFASFIALLRLTSLALGWISSRTAWVALVNGWYAMLSWLPAWPLPFDLTVPEALRGLAAWVWRDLLPGTADHVALPLMWLALTAVVFGWREFRAADVLVGLPAVAQGRLPARRWRGVQISPTSPIVRIAAWATIDLRVKYLPLASALRLLLRAGPVFVGAYLVVAAALRVLEVGFRSLAERALGPGPAADLIVVLPAIDLVAGLGFTVWSVALYAAAFDRGVVDVTGIGTHPSNAHPVGASAQDAGAEDDGAGDVSAADVSAVASARPTP